MEKPKILVTGALGRIGKRIQERFANQFTIIPTDNEDLDNEHYFKMDIAKEESVAASLKQLKEKIGDNLASVIHLAAYYSFGEQNWKKYQKITIDGTERLLRNLKANFQVEQFIFSSTQLVFKTQPLGKEINEESPLRPEWEYPQSKVITENVLFENHGSIPLVILRIAGCYDEECNSIPISQQISRIYNRSPQMYLFPGNPSHGSPFLHFDDLVEAFYLAVKKRHELPKESVIILSEEETYSYDQIQRKLGKLILQKEFTTFSIPKFAAKVGSWIENHLPFYPKPFTQPWMIDIADSHYDMDISLAKSLLNWEPKHDLMKTLPLMVEDLKRNPVEWFKRHKIPVPRSLKKGKK